MMLSIGVGLILTGAMVFAAFVSSLGCRTACVPSPSKQSTVRSTRNTGRIGFDPYSLAFLPCFVGRFNLHPAGIADKYADRAASRWVSLKGKTGVWNGSRPLADPRNSRFLPSRA